MMKRMKKAVSFFMAVILLAGNSYIDFGLTTTTVDTEWVDVSEETSKKPEIKDPLSAIMSMDEFFTEQLRKNRIAAAAAEDTGGYTFLKPGTTNEPLLKGETVTISGSINLAITRIVDGEIKGFDAGVSITSITADNGNNIVKVSDPTASGNGYSASVTAVSPGYTTIYATIKDTNENKIYTLTCFVKVELTVDKTSTEWKNKDNSAENDKVLVLSKNTYRLQLSGVENKNINADLMEIIWENKGIIEVDGAGNIKPVGAGTAKIQLVTKTTDGGRAMTEEIEVVVSPIGSNSHDESKFSSAVDFHTTDTSFTIFTNGNPASNLIWEVYAVTWEGSTPTETKLPADGPLMSYTISPKDGTVEFSNVKAGSYCIKVYSSDEKKYREQSWNKMTVDVVVDLTMESVSKYMSVGDAFSIFDNSNVPDGRFVDLFTVTPDANNAHVASVDVKTGLVTATAQGQLKVVVEYKPSPKDSIYAPGDYGLSGKTNRKLSIEYTFNVIDNITLNTTVLSMYTGATYQLLANVTDRTSPVIWSSSDTTLATVDESGLVKAKKATGNKPVIITATQVINGVEKKVTCTITIQPAVTEITLDPSEVTIDIGKYHTIKAKVSPNNVSGTSLRWLSSDTSIFEVVESSDLAATIQGKAGGVAVLTALNAENIVVGYCKVTITQAATGITLSDTEVTVDIKQKTYQLYATLTPEETSNKTIIWESQNTKIATVDKNGKVTFKSSGTVTISAQSEDNPLLIAYCTFNITKDVTGLKLDYHDIELYTGESRRLTYVLSPANASNIEVEWISFDTSVVAVKNGMLTAKGPGTTQVMIMSVADSSYWDICTVVVKQQATGVKMNYTKVEMDRGDYFDMEVTITPADSTEASLIWESLNTKVVTVSSTGRLTGRGVGTAIVLVKTQSGATSYCEVTVREPVVSLSLDPTEVTIDVGEKFTIEPVFKPATASNMAVKWTSSNESVAEVNALGEVEGFTGGTTVITCEALDGGYRAFCLVKVVEAVVDVKINPDSYRIGLGKTYLLTATITNHGTASDIGIEWSSEDESICSVDKNGRITGNDYGKTIIRAEAADGYGAYATCEVEVVREVTSIRVNHSSMVIVQGESAALKATVNPSNATYNTASFRSDDETIASVDEDGIITGITPGSTWVWAEAQDNSGKYARCWVTVIKPVPATGVTVSDKKIVLVSGEKKQIIYSMKPTTTTDSVSWSSNNDAIATVDGDGNVTAHRTGTCTVTVMTTSGKTAAVEVIVLGLSRTKVEIPVYTKYTRLYVEGADGTVRWDVDDPTICEVANGVITARKVGKTTITATVNGRTLECTVKVMGNDE